MEVCGHHVHEVQLTHLRLPDSIRTMVAAKLSDGVTISTILDSVRDNVEGIDHTALLCRQDVHNIKHQYNIEGTKLHENDHTRVSLWVEGMRNQATDNDDDNPILIFKQQGQEQTGDVDDTGKNDLLIGIQTSFQREMLKKFGPTAICMDSTHGTNVYDFYLITILVLDDLGEGVPVGWIVSNREDAAIIICKVLSRIKEKCGDIHTYIFMSDDADNFFNAWRGVFTVTNTKKLICAWHVDKSWRKGLQNHISS